jgi:hypothetical protein
MTGVTNLAPKAGATEVENNPSKVVVVSKDYQKSIQ